MVILLIEDSESVVSTLVKGIQEATFHVVRTISEAKTYLIEHTVDMILLDLGLPDSYGPMTLRSLVDVKIPKVVLTEALVGPEMAQIGAFGFVVKGRDESEMLEAVRFNVEKCRPKLRFPVAVFEELKACLQCSR